MCGLSQMMAAWVKDARSCARVACAYARARARVPGHRRRTAPRWPEYMVLTEVSSKLMRSMCFPVAAQRTPKYRHQRQAAVASGGRLRRGAERVFRRKKPATRSQKRDRQAVASLSSRNRRGPILGTARRSQKWDRVLVPRGDFFSRRKRTGNGRRGTFARARRPAPLPSGGGQGLLCKRKASGETAFFLCR